MDDVVVVGAAAAGLAAAETLRLEGFDGRLHIVGQEPDLPYDRPPLSKRVLSGEWPSGRTDLRGADALESLDAEWILATAAAALDVDRRAVRLSDGRNLRYDGLVVATGVRAKELPFGHDLDGVHTLRTRADADTLRAALSHRPRVVVVGAGFLGAEVAAVVRRMGLDVSLVDPQSAPMRDQLGPTVAGALARLHASHGVDLHLSVGVGGFEEDRGRVTGVRLTDGSLLAADLVLVAVGSVPNTGWLRDSGLDVVDGVACDELCRAAPGVVAAGDVARWFHPALGRRLRVEHRMNAAEQGRAAALTLLGRGMPFVPVPFAWSDQYDVTIQTHGVIPPATRADIVAGSVEEGRFAAVYRDAEEVVAAVSWNLPREARSLRKEVTQTYDRWAERQRVPASADRALPVSPAH